MEKFDDGIVKALSIRTIKIRGDEKEQIVYCDRCHFVKLIDCLINWMIDNLIIDMRNIGISRDRRR